MAVTRATPDIPQNLVNTIRNIPGTGSTFGDIFDSIRRALIEFDTRISSIKTTGPAVSTPSPVGTSIASYLDTGVVTPFDTAVARDAGVRAGDAVSVLDFEADPTGVADSTAAIQAAIASVQNGVGTLNLHIPFGTYKIGAQIQINGTIPVRIIAEPGVRFIRPASFNIANPMLRLNVAGCAVENISFESNDVADTLGIRVTGPGCDIRRCSFDNFGRSIYTTTTANGLVVIGCVFAQRAAATLPCIELVSNTACVILDNTFISDRKWVVVESGTSSINYVPANRNYLSGAVEVVLDPVVDSTSGILSNTLVLPSIDPMPTTKVSTLVRDDTTLKIIDRDGATTKILATFTPADDNLEVTALTAQDIDSNLLASNVGVFARILGIAGGETTVESDAIPDTTALFRFRPAADAIDVSVTATTGPAARVWKQLYPPVYPPTAENVASVTMVVDYLTNENGSKVKWRATGVITFGANRTTIKRYISHLVGPSVSGGDPLMDQEFGFWLNPPAAPDTDTYATEYFDLPVPDSQFKVAIYVYDAFGTLTPAPVDSGYVAVDAPEAALDLGLFSFEVTVVYYGAQAWAVDWDVTIPAGRDAVQAIVPMMSMDPVSTDVPWIQFLGDQDVPTTGPAVFRTGRGDWFRPEIDTVNVCQLYIRDIYNRLLGPIEQPINVYAFVFSNISSISLSFNVDDYPGFARVQGTSVIPTSGADPEFSGVRVYGFYGDPTGITFDDLFLVADVDHEPLTAGPMTFDFNVAQPATAADLRLYFPSKHQDIYDAVVFAGPSSTPYVDFAIPAATGVANPPSDVGTPGTITLTGTDPLTRVLECTMDVPTAPNGFDGALVYKLVGGTDLYQLGFAHHPVGAGSPFNASVVVFLPETIEVDDEIFFQAHANTGMVADLVLSGGSPTPSGLVTLPARPTSTSTAPLADAIASISGTVETKPGFFRFVITVVYPTPRTSIIQTLIEISGPYVSGTPERRQDWNTVSTPASGDYVTRTGWFEHDGSAQDYKLHGTSLNEDNIPTLPSVDSATITVPTAVASGGASLATGLALTRIATGVGADGVEQTKMKLVWTNPTSTLISHIYGTVRVSTQPTSEEQFIFTRLVADDDAYGDTDDESLGPWPTVSESYVASIYSVDFNGNVLGPVTTTLAVTAGSGALNLARSATASFAGSNFVISGGQFKIKAAGVTPTELDSANIFVTNFAGNLDIGRINNVYTLLIDNFTGNLNASKITNLTALNIGSMSGNINFTQVNNLGSFNVGSFSGAIVTSQVQANFLADLSKFAQDLRPIGRVSSLPGLPNAAYPINTIVLNAVDSRLYKTTNGTTWTLVAASDSISGKIVSTDVLSINANVINGILNVGVVNQITMSQLNGTLSIAQANAVNIGTFGGSLTAGQIGVIQGSNIQNIQANTITIGLIQNSQIQSISASKLDVGVCNVSITLNAATINSPTINVPMSGGSSVTISNTVGVRIIGSTAQMDLVNGLLQITGLGGSFGATTAISAGNLTVARSGGLFNVAASGGSVTIDITGNSGGWNITPSLIDTDHFSGSIRMESGNQYISSREFRLAANFTPNGSLFQGGPYTMSFIWFMYRANGTPLGFIPILN